MSQLNLILAKAKTLVANGTITAMTGVNALIQCTVTAHGLETGDIVQISGVASPAGGANGQWVVTKVDANNFTLNNSLGTGTWASGGTVVHIGFATPALLVDNTVFASAPDFTLQGRIESLSSGSNARMLFTDAADAAFVTEQPLAAFHQPGAIAVSYDVTKSYKKEDTVDARIAASGDNFRAKLYISGGPGSKATFSAWLRW